MRILIRGISDDVTLLPLANSELAMGSMDKLTPQRDFRVRILPVLGPLSAFFCLHIATHVLCELAGRPIALCVIIRSSTNGLLYHESRIAEKDQVRIFFLLFSGRALPLLTEPHYVVRSY
jgi:hypothetical protein